MCLVIWKYPESHEKILLTYLGLYLHDINYTSPFNIMFTLSICGNNLGSQVFLHHKSMCPFMCIQSIGGGKVRPGWAMPDQKYGPETINDVIFNHNN